MSAPLLYWPTMYVIHCTMCRPVAVEPRSPSPAVRVVGQVGFAEGRLVGALLPFAAHPIGPQNVPNGQSLAMPIGTRLAKCPVRTGTVGLNGQTPEAMHRTHTRGSLCWVGTRVTDDDGRCGAGDPVLTIAIRGLFRRTHARLRLNAARPALGKRPLWRNDPKSHGDCPRHPIWQASRPEQDRPHVPARPSRSVVELPFPPLGSTPRAPTAHLFLAPPVGIRVAASPALAEPNRS
jgi:hypothetical protein